MFILPGISDSQHGFQPGKGTMTAWREIISKVINSPDIYEFDLEKFFDQVNLNTILRRLGKLGAPKTLRGYIKGLLQS